MKTSDIVMFKEILEKGDETLMMRVIEVNGDRIMVEALVNLSILPVNVYPISSLMVVKEA